MVATITPTYDSTYDRVGVELGGWAADGPVVVYRNDGGPLQAVRAANPANVSSGAYFSWDYESPFNVPVTYQAYDGVTLVQSAPITVASSTAWLRAPGLPSLDTPIAPLGKPSPVRGRDSATLRPIGQPEAVVLFGVRQAPTFVLQVRTRTDAEAYALEALLGQAAVVLLVLPGTRTDYQYVFIGDVPESPVVPFIEAPGFDVGAWADWGLDCTVTTVPAGGIFGDPTASYQAVLDEYTSYSDLLARKTSYLAVLRGVEDPTIPEGILGELFLTGGP